MLNECFMKDSVVGNLMNKVPTRFLIKKKKTFLSSTTTLREGSKNTWHPLVLAASGLIRESCFFTENKVSV